MFYKLVIYYYVLLQFKLCCTCHGISFQCVVRDLQKLVCIIGWWISINQIFNLFNNNIDSKINFHSDSLSLSLSLLDLLIINVLANNGYNKSRRWYNNGLVVGSNWCEQWLMISLLNQIDVQFLLSFEFLTSYISVRIKVIYRKNHQFYNNQLIFKEK